MHDSRDSREMRGSHDSGDSAAPQRDAPRRQNGYTAFRVSWGDKHGADPRRLLAVVCRRGDIQGKDVGAIEVDRTHSVVDVADAVAEHFEAAAKKSDPKEPRVMISRELSPSELRGNIAARGPRPPFRKGPGAGKGGPFKRKR